MSNECVCGHYAIDHGNTNHDYGCQVRRCRCQHYETRLFTREAIERSRGPNPSPVVAVATMQQDAHPSPIAAVVAVHEDGSYTLLEQKAVERVVLYMDERNQFGAQAAKWFEGINHLHIPVSGGLPRATQGAASYRYENGELEQFARSLRPVRVFKRINEDPESGIDYEMCSVCSKHIRHHYGSISYNNKLPPYRCDPAY